MIKKRPRLSSISLKDMVSQEEDKCYSAKLERYLYFCHSKTQLSLSIIRTKQKTIIFMFFFCYFRVDRMLLHNLITKSSGIVQSPLSLIQFEILSLQNKLLRKRSQVLKLVQHPKHQNFVVYFLFSFIISFIFIQYHF